MKKVLFSRKVAVLYQTKCSKIKFPKAKLKLKNDRLESTNREQDWYTIQTKTNPENPVTQDPSELQKKYKNRLKQQKQS